MPLCAYNSSIIYTTICSNDLTTALRHIFSWRITKREGGLSKCILYANAVPLPSLSSPYVAILAPACNELDPIRNAHEQTRYVSLILLITLGVQLLPLSYPRNLWHGDLRSQVRFLSLWRQPDIVWKGSLSTGRQPSASSVLRTGAIFRWWRLGTARYVMSKNRTRNPWIPWLADATVLATAHVSYSLG